MILVTVGTTMPFDELIEEIDLLSGQGFFDGEEVYCQSGQSAYVMLHAHQFRSRPTLQDLIDRSSMVISHGGATVAQLLAAKRPFVCFPNPRAAGGHQASFVSAMSAIAPISWSLDVRQAADLIAKRRLLGPATVDTKLPRAADIIMKTLGSVGALTH